jgi:hypothetical protein
VTIYLAFYFTCGLVSLGMEQRMFAKPSMWDLVACVALGPVGLGYNLAQLLTKRS